MGPRYESHKKVDRARGTYRLAVTQFTDWLKNENRSIDVGDITKDDVQGFILWFMETRSPSTAKQRHASLAVLFRWPVEEGEIEANPMAGVKPPKVPEKVIPVASQRQVHALCGIA